MVMLQWVLDVYIGVPHKILLKKESVAKKKKVPEKSLKSNSKIL